MTSQLGEFYSLTTNDGQILTMPDQQIALIEEGGFGAPPVQWITKQGYKQHGETEVGYVLQKRQIDLKLHFSHACTRLQYWQNRAFIQDILRHNRLGPLTLTIILPGDNSSSTIYSGATVITAVGINDLIIRASKTSPFSIGMIVLLDQEYMQITGIDASSGNINVIRAVGGGGSLSHANGTLIYIVKNFNQFSTVSGKRSILVRADPGMIMPSDPVREANWYVQESIKFIAFNPIWFDPNINNINIAAASQQNLIFPITFPITFGVAGFLFTTSIIYAGSWYEYPTITLTGPYNAAIISNVTTGISFTMNVPLAAGNQRIITTTPGAINVVDQNGNNFFGELGPNSNLVDFNLRPAPEAPKGINTINVSMINTGAQSAASLSYSNRFYGI